MFIPGSRSLSRKNSSFRTPVLSPVPIYRDGAKILPGNVQVVAWRARLTLMQATKTVLGSGLRVITIPQAESRSVAVLVAVATGSNYESREENGLSHFLEHMVFKGSKNYPGMNDISVELESLGAKNNAFTGNEYTGYYAIATSDHLSKVVDVLGDMYLYPLLPAAEIEKERGVIIEEINMYEDQPQYKVSEVLDELLYGDTPAGRSVAGTKENLHLFTQDHFKNYLQKHYQAESTVVVVAGNFKSDEALKLIKDKFADIPTGNRENKEPVTFSQDKPAFALQYKKSDQAHLRMAFRGLNLSDKREPVQEVLATVLGGGMSSRLFRRIRDELGAAYYVGASSDPSTDHGVVVVRAGADKDRADLIVKEILNECSKLKTELVEDKELMRAKNYLIGHYFLDFESNIHLAQYYGLQEALGRPLITPEEWKREIELVTAEDILNLAKELFKNEGLNLAIIGPFENKEVFEGILKI